MLGRVTPLSRSINVQKALRHEGVSKSFGTESIMKQQQ